MKDNVNNDVITKARLSLELREKNPRVQALYDRLSVRLTKRQKVWGSKLSILTPESEKLSPMFRRVVAFEKVMNEMPIGIEAGDLIAGISLDDGIVIRCVMPTYRKSDEKGEVTVAMTHKTPDYATLLEKGFSGIADDINKKLKELESSSSPDKQQSVDLLNAMKREGTAVVAMANRFATLAEEMAEACEDSTQKDELLEMAAVCRRVPEFPARTLREAIQSFWVVNYAFYQTETNISNGLLDRVFNPYFEKDYNSGVISLEQAQELIDCLCLRMNDRGQILPDNYVVDDDEDGLFDGWHTKAGRVKRDKDIFIYGHNRRRVSVASDQADAINHWGQNVLIGGLGQGRKDQTSVLTYLFLNSFEKLKLSSPVLTVRCHKDSPTEYINRAAECLKTGGGMPYINNDDIIISAYERLGVPYEDACEYANSNCWETLLQGMSNQEMIRGINHLLMVELVLNRGKTMIYGGQAGPDTGDPTKFKSFEEFKEAWRIQLDYMLELTIKEAGNMILNDGTHGKQTYCPLMSSIMKDCIETATDMCHGGARYIIWHVLGEAVSNAADAMTAIKRLVFDEKRYTMEQIVEILKSDFATPEGESLRLRALMRYPKFGNDNDEVDELAAWQIDHFNTLIEKYSAQFRPKIIFPPCIATFSWIISIGKEIAASLDGRRNSEPISANMSPVPGSDVSGPTAAINSYLKLDTSPMAAGAAIDLRISSNGLEGDEGTYRLVGLIKTFLEQGGNMLTMTITSIDELHAAIAEPDKYRNLRVRMGGWSAYFVLLGEEHQKIHLSRVEHGLV